jgi:hypothetical protein
MKSLRRAVLLLAIVAANVFAAKFWETKDYQSWNPRDCEELLSKSPWAYTTTFRIVTNVMVDSGSFPTNERATASAPGPTFGEGETSITLEFRMLSALPVKLAIWRLQALQRPGDAEAINAQITKLSNAPPEKTVVIQVGYKSVPAGDSSLYDVRSYFTHATLNDFRTNTYLHTSRSNDPIRLLDYWAPDSRRPNPAFVFSRFDEKGEPLFTGTEKEITLTSQIQFETKRRQQTFNVFVKMNPKQMRFREQFCF